jgi:hypothetical protein
VTDSVVHTHREGERRSWTRQTRTPANRLDGQQYPAEYYSSSSRQNLFPVSGSILLLLLLEQLMNSLLRYRPHTQRCAGLVSWTELHKSETLFSKCIRTVASQLAGTKRMGERRQQQQVRRPLLPSLNSYTAVEHKPLFPHRFAWLNLFAFLMRCLLSSRWRLG